MRRFRRGEGVRPPWRWAVEYAVLGLVLCALVVFAAIGSGWMFAGTMISAWVLMIALMGPEDALDAGWIFTLVALGIAVAVGLAQEGLGAILQR